MWPIATATRRPLQSNGIDCGVFVCAYAECRSKGAFGEFSFHVSDIPRIRRSIKEALLESE